MNKKLKRTSQFLCMVLRHKPQALSLDMDTKGWVSVNQLLKNLSVNNKKLTTSLSELKEIVRTDDKIRYSFKGHDQYIRCNQGHSLSWVVIDFEKYTPTDDLYHGTTFSNLDSIFKEGLTSQKRNVLHLSKDIETAINVGKRYSKENEPAILVISKDAKVDFFISENNVVLTKSVPPEYITLLNR